MTGILLREEALKELVIYYSRNKAQRDRGNDYVLGIGLFVPLAPFACFAREILRKTAKKQKNVWFQSENRDFWPKTVRKRRFHAFFDHFSPA